MANVSLQPDVEGKLVTGQQEETLVSAIERHGTKAFQPSADPASRADGQKDFASLISRYALTWHCLPCISSF